MEDEIFEVEDLIDYKNIGGKDYYLVKWKGYNEASWEPDENIGEGLGPLKEKAQETSKGEGSPGKKKKKKEKKDRKDRGEQKNDDGKVRKRAREERDVSEEDREEDRRVKEEDRKRDDKRDDNRRGERERKKRRSRSRSRSEIKEEVKTEPFPPVLPPQVLPPPMSNMGGVIRMPMPGMPMQPGMMPMPPTSMPHMMMPHMMTGMMAPGMFPGLMKGKGKGSMMMPPASIVARPPRPTVNLSGALDVQDPAPKAKREIHPEATKTQGFGEAHKKRLLTFVSRLRDWEKGHPADAKAREDFVMALNPQRETLDKWKTPQLLYESMWHLFRDEKQRATLIRAVRSSSELPHDFLLLCFHYIAKQVDQHGIEPFVPSSQVLRIALSVFDAFPQDKSSDDRDASFWRKLIVAIYQKHNPAKLQDVDDLLEKYAGRERTVYLGICDKYKISPDPEAMETKDDKKTKSGKNWVHDLVKEYMVEVYTKHNPEKLGAVDSLLERCDGNEELLYKGICEKYGVTPKPIVQLTFTADTYRRMVEDIFREHNPDKLAEMDMLMSKYTGKEEMLYLACCDKYGVQKVVTPSQDPKNDKPLDRTVVKYRTLITEVYRENNPEKLPELDKLFEKYSGKEQMLYRGVCDKYKIDPTEKDDAKLPVRASPYVSLIRTLYEEKNPEKLADLHDLLGKYQGQERELYCKICEKYGVHPLDEEQAVLEVLPPWIYHHGLDDVVAMVKTTVGVFEVVDKCHLTRESCEALVESLELREHTTLKKKRTQVMFAASYDFCLLTREQQLDYAVAFRAERLADLNARLGADPRNPVVSVTDFSEVDHFAIIAKAGTSLLLDKSMQLVQSMLFHVAGLSDSESEHGQAQTEASEATIVPLDIFETRSLDGTLRIMRYTRHTVDLRWSQKRPTHTYAVRWVSRGSREVATELWESIKAVSSEGINASKNKAPNIGLHVDWDNGTLQVTLTAKTANLLEEQMPKVTNALSKRSWASSTLRLPEQTVRRKRQRDESEDGESSSEEYNDDEIPSESYRPLRLNPEAMRDAFFQGMLCLNCDDDSHKPNECEFRRKVCWNCHGNHPGNDCPRRCRFCKRRHEYPIMECMKRVCKRLEDWKKSKPFQDQTLINQQVRKVGDKLLASGQYKYSLAKDKEAQSRLMAAILALEEICNVFPINVASRVSRILKPKKPTPPEGEPPLLTFPSVPKKLTPEPPSSPAVPLPDIKFPYTEKIYIDELLRKPLYGANIMSRILGRGGLNHKRMEGESGARVFFRGLGISDGSSTGTMDCDVRLHILVKGSEPKQARVVQLILKEIVDRIDNDLEEKGDRAGRLADIPRDATHPFLPLVPLRMLHTTPGEVLSKTTFTFNTNAHGSVLMEMERWLANHGMLMSDGPRTVASIEGMPLSHQVQWAETFRPIVEAFNRMIDEWQEPAAYWFHDDELIDTSFFNNFGVSNGDEYKSYAAVGMQEFSSCALSIKTVHNFADLMLAGEIIDPRTPRQDVVNALRSMRGVIRAKKENAELLVYIKYPWALYANPDLARFPFPKKDVDERLQHLGRIGVDTSTGLLFRGYLVEWRLPGSKQQEYDLADGQVETRIDVPWHAQEEMQYHVERERAYDPSMTNYPPQSMPHPMLPNDQLRMPQRPLPEPPFPYDPSRLEYAPQFQPAYEVPYDPMQLPQLSRDTYDQPFPPEIPPAIPMQMPVQAFENRIQIPTTGRIYVSQCWIPMEVYPAAHLRERISGPNDSHFAHILGKHGPDNLEVVFQGLPNAQAPINQRLKVVMRSPREDVVNGAFADLMDLVETLVEVVAEELIIPRHQIDAMLKNISTECFVMLDGQRIESLPSQADIRRQKEERERARKEQEQYDQLIQRQHQEQQVHLERQRQALAHHAQQREREQHEREVQLYQEQLQTHQPRVDKAPAIPTAAPLPTEDGEYELVSDDEYVAISESDETDSDLTTDFV